MAKIHPSILFWLEVLLSITYIVLFIFLIQKVKFFDLEGFSKNLIVFVFVLKLIAGATLWAIYTFYYTDRITADIFKYFDASKIMFDAFKESPSDFFKMITGIGDEGASFVAYYDQMHFWNGKPFTGIFNSNHIIIRLNTLFRFFSLGYYSVHVIFMCFISLIGLTAIFKTFSPLLNDKKKELFIAIFFFPSVILWSSGVLKEGLTFFSLGLFVYNFQNLSRPKNLLVVLLSGVILLSTKYYVFVSILPGLLFLKLTKKNGSKLFFKFCLTMLVCLFIGLNMHRVLPLKKPLLSLSLQQQEASLLASGKKLDANNNPIPIPNSAFEINPLEPTITSLLINAPQAITNTLFRPFVWELKSPMLFLAGIENCMLIAFIIVCVLFKKSNTEIDWKHILFITSFVLILFAIIGLTTPIIGAIARYKAPAIPFLLTAFLFMLDKNKISRKFPIYQKMFP